MEKILKDKFSNNWESVRKAFLALDSDYDGFITVEDILRYFGQEKELNFNDLQKLIKDKEGEGFEFSKGRMHLSLPPQEGLSPAPKYLVFERY